MKARCYQCVDKRATFPKEEPVFCTQRCAADYGVSHTLSLYWCSVHNEWNDNGCWACENDDDEEQPDE
jgi:hypothetical protein